MPVKLPKHTKRAEVAFQDVKDAAHALYEALLDVRPKDAPHVLRRLEQVAFECYEGDDQGEFSRMCLNELDIVNVARMRVANDHDLEDRDDAAVCHSWAVATVAPVPIDPYKP